MVLLVALANALQDLDRLFERRLFHHDRLEAALERGVPLDVLAVLVERGGADALQLAAGQRRLEDVGGVDRALGGAGADQGVQLVDEEDDIVRVLRISSMIFLRRSSNSPRYFVPATSEPMSRVSTRLSEQGLRDVAGDDALGQPFDDGGLADAGLADQGRVVLGAAGQDLDDALDLLLATDDRIELARRAASVRSMPSWSRVGVLLARLVSWAGAAEDDCDRTLMSSCADLVEAHAKRLENPGRDPFALADEAEQQVLGADVVVAEAAGLVDRELDDPLGARRQPDLADDRPIAAADDELDGRADLGQLDVHVLEDVGGHALAFAHQAQQEVLGPDVVVVEPLGFVLRKRQDSAGPVRELVKTIHSVERLFPLRPPREATPRAMLAPGPVSDPIPIQRAVVPGSAAARAGLEHGDIISWGAVRVLGRRAECLDQAHARRCRACDEPP